MVRCKLQATARATWLPAQEATLADTRPPHTDITCLGFQPQAPFLILPWQAAGFWSRVLVGLLGCIIGSTGLLGYLCVHWRSFTDAGRAVRVLGNTEEEGTMQQKWLS